MKIQLTFRSESSPYLAAIKAAKRKGVTLELPDLVPSIQTRTINGELWLIAFPRPKLAKAAL